MWINFIVWYLYGFARSCPTYTALRGVCAPANGVCVSPMDIQGSEARLHLRAVYMIQYASMTLCLSAWTLRLSAWALRAPVRWWLWDSACLLQGLLASGWFLSGIISSKSDMGGLFCVLCVVLCIHPTNALLSPSRSYLLSAFSH